jgi:hypothetical protein
LYRGEPPKPHRIVIPKRHEDRRRAAVGPLTGAGRALRAIGFHEDQAFGYEQNGSRVLPADAEPFGFGAGMQERSAVAVLGYPANPASDLVAIERGIEPDTPRPWLAKPVIGFAQTDLATIPRTRVRSARVEIEWPQGVDDPLRRQVDLGGPDGLLVRAEGHRDNLTRIESR